MQISNMHFDYVQSTGRLHYGDYELLVTGYSGDASHKNDPSYQEVRGVGPIPAGWYQIGAAYDDEHRGEFTMALIPHASNKMFGRSGFLIHADSVLHPGTASSGCIIMPAIVRFALAYHPCRWLRVIPYSDHLQSEVNPFEADAAKLQQDMLKQPRSMQMTPPVVK